MHSLRWDEGSYSSHRSPSTIPTSTQGGAYTRDLRQFGGPVEVLLARELYGLEGR